MGQGIGTSTAVWHRWGWYVVLGSLTLALVGVMGSKAVACTDILPGSSYDPFVSPSGDFEILDGVDNDCDGTVDESLGGSERVVQLALVEVDRVEAELGDTAAVTALVRVWAAEFDRAELRTGDGAWELMTSMPFTEFSPNDTSVGGTTAPFTTSGAVPVCVRAFDSSATVSSEDGVCVTVTVAPADPEGPSVVFEGFGAAVGPDNELVGARAGRSVPLTFALLDDGAAVTSTSEVEVITVPLGEGCEPLSDGAESVSAEDAGRSRLRYDTDEGQFVFAWKTQREWAGTCRAVEVLYDDEVVGTATVSFTG